MSKNGDMFRQDMNHHRLSRGGILCHLIFHLYATCFLIYQYLIHLCHL